MSRAVDRLREFFTKRGVTVGASGLAVVIATNAVQAAPVGLAAIISTTASAALGISVAANAGTMSGFFGSLAQVSKIKVATGLAATVLVGTATLMFFLFQSAVDQNPFTDAEQATLPNADQFQHASEAAIQETEDQDLPDPLNLLQAVARARQGITSGSMEFELSIEHLRPERNDVNHLQLAAVFDGNKFRFEELGREYSYTYSAMMLKQKRSELAQTVWKERRQWGRGCWSRSSRTM